jgi:cystathionine beta-lyase
MTNFDKVHSRLNTNSVKWDSIVATYKEKDLLPLWVADMDFLAPTPVKNALQQVIDQGIYGYTVFPDSLYEAIISWQKRKHNYVLEKEDILFNSGVVPSLALAVQSYTKEGDSVLIHDPVYPPFAAVVEKNQRQLVRHTLIERNGHFEIDPAAMEADIVDNDVKLMILCNPHNPGGRVWTSKELQTIGEICHRHQVIVVSDEIHQDIVFAPNTFVSFQTVDPAFAEFSIVLTSATKTFNLAGIKNSMIFIKNPDLKKQFVIAQEKNVQSEINTFGIVATEAAYRDSEDWLDELLDYLSGNIEWTCRYLTEQLPKVQFQKPEGTYLMWLDFSAYGLSDRELQRKLIKEAKVVLNPGINFGPAGTQHMRINLACPRETLQKGLLQIAATFKESKQ